MLYEQAKHRLVQIDKEIPYIERKLQEYPEGNLFIAGTGKYTKWYKSLNGRKEYITKSNSSLASSLAAKRYWRMRVKELKTEREALQCYLLRMGSDSGQADAMFYDYKYENLMKEAFTQTIPEIGKWLSEPYVRSQNHPEHLIHKTYAGHMVRSKSEAMIANYLYTRKLPYRYECLLELEGQAFYPDFTILHPMTKKIWYYEHFGKMDDPEYVKKVSNKLRMYSRNGIFMSQNLVATFETEKSPLDIMQVEQLIQYYFE